VLAAIANHTLGGAPLDRLSQILYVADWIEPTRQGEDVEQVRCAAERSLLEAVLVGTEQTILELVASRRPIHPRTLHTRNWALEHLHAKEAS
jgi:predicted HD superfamily hydrolase involved in NAD metabolism